MKAEKKALVKKAEEIAKMPEGDEKQQAEKEVIEAAKELEKNTTEPDDAEASDLESDAEDASESESDAEEKPADAEASESESDAEEKPAVDASKGGDDNRGGERLRKGGHDKTGVKRAEMA